MTLSIIIVTYYSYDLIKDCIDSIYINNNIGDGNLEIIIVENSDEQESERLRQFIYLVYGNKIKFVKNDNLGYGQGNNVGIKISTGDIITIMNPDVLVTVPIFSRVIKTFSKMPKLALLGGRQFGRKNISYYIRPEKEIHFITLFLMIILNRINVFNSKYMFPSGAFLFIRKEAFEAIGLFDEKMFLYCEEPDITERFLRAGYSVRYDKKLPYQHLIDDRDDLSDYSFKEALISTEYYFNKFSYNFKFFIKQKIFSYKLMLFFAKMSGNKKLQNKFKTTGDKFLSFYNNKFMKK